MLNLILSVLYLLLFIALLAGLYRVAQWVFAKLSIDVPQQVYTIIGVILVLLVLIWLVTALFQGGPMPWQPAAWR
jgi:hypothetical protein